VLVIHFSLLPSRLLIIIAIPANSKDVNNKNDFLLIFFASVAAVILLSMGKAISRSPCGNQEIATPIIACNMPSFTLLILAFQVCALTYPYKEDMESK